jgi:hypothetical protein
VADLTIIRSFAMRFQPTAETLAIVERLGGHWNGRYALVPCPAHEDRTPSLSIRRGSIRSSSIALPDAMGGCHAGHPRGLGHPVGPAGFACAGQ